MTEESTGVEGVADPQPAEDNQSINWSAAQETMAQQKQQLEAEKMRSEMLEQQINVFQSYMNQPKEQAQPEPSPLDSISNDDVLTGAEFKSALEGVLSQKERQYQEQMKQTQQQMAVMNMRAQHSDYDDAVSSAMEMAKTNPELAQALSTSSNPQLLAYQLGRGSIQQPQASQVEAAHRMVENAQKPAPASSATTGGSSLNAVDQIWNDSPQDFEKRIAQIKRGSGY